MAASPGRTRRSSTPSFFPLGNDFYQGRLSSDLDPAALGGDKMKEAFDRMTKLRSYVDDNFSGPRLEPRLGAWSSENKAGLQFMGDWAKGEFLKAKKVPGTDLSACASPERKVRSPSIPTSSRCSRFRRQGSGTAADGLGNREPAFQSAFNVVKGSVPARTDVPDTDFEPAARRASRTSRKQIPTARSSAPWPRPCQSGCRQERDLRRGHTPVHGELDSEEAVTELVAAVEAAK